MENKKTPDPLATIMPADREMIGKVCRNVKSDYIEITHDKLENILLKHLGRLATQRAWITPFSLVITALLANVTATFTKKFGIDAAVWDALFLLLAAGSGMWLLYSVGKLLIRWESSSLPHLMSIIKNTTPNGSRTVETEKHHPASRL